MALGDSANNEQTKTSTLLAGGERTRHAIKTFEHALHFISGNTDAVIFHANVHGFAQCSSFDHYFDMRPRVFDGVINQIRNGRLDFVGIAINGKIAPRFKQQRVMGQAVQCAGALDAGISREG